MIKGTCHLQSLDSYNRLTIVVGSLPIALDVKSAVPHIFMPVVIFVE